MKQNFKIWEILNLLILKGKKKHNKTKKQPCVGKNMKGVAQLDKDMNWLSQQKPELLIKTVGRLVRHLNGSQRQWKNDPGGMSEIIGGLPSCHRPGDEELVGQKIFKGGPTSAWISLTLWTPLPVFQYHTHQPHKHNSSRHNSKRWSHLELPAHNLSRGLTAVGPSQRASCKAIVVESWGGVTPLTPNQRATCL